MGCIFDSTWRMRYLFILYLFHCMSVVQLKRIENIGNGANCCPLQWWLILGSLETTLTLWDWDKMADIHDDVIKWKHFPCYWPFAWGIHRSPVNSPHKGQWHGALMFSLICVWINGWVNNREAGDLRRYRTHYDVIVVFHIRRFQIHFLWWKYMNFD